MGTPCVSTRWLGLKRAGPGDACRGLVRASVQPVLRPPPESGLPCPPVPPPPRAGCPPYYDLQPMSALYNIVQDLHPPLPADISSGMRDFLLRCFQKVGAPPSPPPPPSHLCRCLAGLQGGAH